MWEKNRRSRWAVIAWNVFLVMLIIGLLCVLIYMYLQANRRAKAEDQQLVSAYLEAEQSGDQTTQTAINQNKEASLAELNAEYQADLDCLAEYLPGIVCWGDELTAGTAGGVSFPGTLQEYINYYIVNKYDFASSLPNAGNYTGVTWKDYTISVPVVNMGAGEESTGTILGRSGTAPLVVQEEFTIPATTEEVTVKLVTADGREANPSLQGGMNPVTIAGVEGRLRMVSSTWSSYYTFSRLEDGAETTVASGTSVISASQDEYKDYIQIIFMGTYGGYDSVDELIEQQKQLINRQIKNNDRYIIIGLYYLSRYASSYGGSEAVFTPYESAMLQEYGDHFINLRKYLTTDAMDDAGLTATKDDETEMRRGRVPRSLLSKNDGTSAELTATGYKLIGKLVFERMDTLGYFDEVREELGIQPRGLEDELSRSAQE